MKPLLICLALVLAVLSAHATIVVFYSDGTNIFAGSDGKLLRPGNGKTETGPKIWRAGNTIFGVAGISEDTGFKAHEICRNELLRSGDVDAAIPRIEGACSNALLRVGIENPGILPILMLPEMPGLQLGFGFLRSGKPEFRLSQFFVSTNYHGLTVSISRSKQPPWLSWWIPFPAVEDSISSAADEKFWDAKGGFGGLETVIRSAIKAAPAVGGTIGFPIYRMRLGPDGIIDAPLITSP